MLLPLPAGLPEPNLAEQVRHQLSSRSLGNRCYNGYEQIAEACRHAWNIFTQVPGAIRSLRTRQWANLDIMY
ncbi:MAG: hypothetical protein NVSMB6_21650 [Burkholderiaceae bacterium]